MYGAYKAFPCDARTFMKMFWPWRTKVTTGFTVPLSGDAQTTILSDALSCSSRPAQVGVVTVPAIGPSPTLVTPRISIDSLDSGSGVPSISALSSVSSRTASYVATPWSDVTFGPSVNTISP